MKLQDDKDFALIMERGYKRDFIISLFLLFFLFSPCTTNAGALPAKAGESVRSEKEELLCRNIKEKISNREDIRKIVKTSIQMGYNACSVIKCSIQGGGDLRQIITGAVDAGATKDIISKCALDAGAEAKEVAVILSSLSSAGLCYMLPEGPEIIVPPAPVFISPSKF